MKLKVLPVMLAMMTLASCGANQPATSTASEPATSTSAPVSWMYLDFLTGEKPVRFDVYDFEEGLQVSYGNAVLTNVTNLTLNDNATLSINKNLTEDKELSIVVVKETAAGRSSATVNKGITGDNFTEYFETILKNELIGFDRAYVTFTMGPKAKWERGLNTKMDNYLDLANN